jgi:hypothetical protein
MTDKTQAIMARLRSGATTDDLILRGGVTYDERCLEAADFIEAQAAEIERLREIAEWYYTDGDT